uniref:Major facilitator superfamily (MFS) profile domain-containing protein n=1 Tax=Alexandrium monilatum TaxID=311494 RepID=A0A7S4W8L8_9DINO|mmetsp:Transcript_45978/g.144115  ORF Transcript_45978/g.144115 Transcript_45978/m.144115 type:complete len:438 (-) Transcript_45978:60-1373(-)
MAATANVWPLALLVSLFVLWGAANNLNDILIKQFQKAFTLGDMQASLVQSAFYTGYFIGALPAARLARAYGYKISITTGLALFSVGAFLFFPISRNGGSYPGFLVCLYLIAFGLAFLESAANPWIVLLGDSSKPGSGSGILALNFAQAFNPLGSIGGILIGRFFILDGREYVPPQGKQTLPGAMTEYQRHEAAMVGVPYVVLGCVVAVLTLCFICTKFPRTSADDSEPDRQLTFARFCACANRLWRVPGFAQGLLAQFTYVGAQVCIWSFVIRLVQAELPGVSETRAADFMLFSLVTFMLGRFAAAALLLVVNERRLLCIYAVFACLMTVIIAAVRGRAAVAAVCAASFFMSMMYPTIFGLVLAPLDGQDTEVAAALLVMMVVGGAAVAPVMGGVSDASSIALAYLVPGACFLNIAAFAAQHSLGRFHAEFKPLLRN